MSLFELDLFRHKKKPFSNIEKEEATKLVFAFAISVNLLKNISLVYWNYYLPEREMYDKEIKQHKIFEREIRMSNPIDTKVISKLAEILDKTNLTELEYEDESCRISL